MAWILWIFLGALLAILFPAIHAVFAALGPVFVVLGLLIGTGVFLYALSCGVEGTLREAGAMWHPLTRWLPEGLQPYSFWLLVAGGMGAFVAFSVTVHLLMGR
jgi:hypothetical protein